MPQKNLRVIIDTNLWISFLLSKRLVTLDKLFHQNKVKILFSQELLEEFLTVISRPKFRKYFSKKDVDALLMEIDQHAEFIAVQTTIDKCRDEKDNFLLSLAIDGKANYLITGDQDLLELVKIGKTRIVNYAQFNKTMKAS